jgi:hypothetical protein
MKETELPLVARPAFTNRRAILLTRHGEPRLAYEFVVLRVIGAFEADANGRVNPLLGRADDIPRPKQGPIRQPPELEVGAKFYSMLFVEAGDYDLNDDFSRLITVIQITATVEVVLVDRLGSRQPVGANGKLDRLEYRRFTDVVIAQQHRRAVEGNVSEADTSEILDVNPDNPHVPPPLLLFFVAALL